MVLYYDLHLRGQNAAGAVVVGSQSLDAGGGKDKRRLWQRRRKVSERVPPPRSLSALHEKTCESGKMKTERCKKQIFPLRLRLNGEPTVSHFSANE